MRTGETLDNGSVDNNPSAGRCDLPRHQRRPIDLAHHPSPARVPIISVYFCLGGSRFAEGGENPEAGNRMKVLLPHVESVCMLQADFECPFLGALGFIPNTPEGPGPRTHRHSCEMRLKAGRRDSAVELAILSSTPQSRLPSFNRSPSNVERASFPLLPDHIFRKI